MLQKQSKPQKNEIVGHDSISTAKEWFTDLNALVVIRYVSHNQHSTIESGFENVLVKVWSRTMGFLTGGGIDSACENGTDIFSFSIRDGTYQFDFSLILLSSIN